MKISPLAQETDDGAEDLLGYLQPGGAMRADPENSESFGVRVQVHRSVQDVIFTVSARSTRGID